MASKTEPFPHLRHGLRTVGTVVLMTMLLIGIGVDLGHAANKVAIIAIDEDAATLRTIKGVKSSIDRYGLGVVYQEALLRGDPASDSTTVSTLKGFTPDLFVTIGSYATEAIAKTFPGQPVIFATVINPQASGFVASMDNPGGNITGAALDIPPDIQFKYFQRVVGQIKTMGILFSSETENIIRQASIAARQLGIKLIALRVENEREIPAAIDSLCKVADVLWSVADHTVFTPQSTKHIILQTLRYQIPLMGFSQSLVEAGGLFSLDFDFKDIGRQAGEIAVRVLRGTAPGTIPVATPGFIYFTYNENTAERIKIKIPEDLLAVAKEVIK